MPNWTMIEYVVERFVAQDDNVVVIGRTAWRNKDTEKVADSPKADVGTLQRQWKGYRVFRVLRHGGNRCGGPIGRPQYCCLPRQPQRRASRRGGDLVEGGAQWFESVAR